MYTYIHISIYIYIYIYIDRYTRSAFGDLYCTVQQGSACSPRPRYTYLYTHIYIYICVCMYVRMYIYGPLRPLHRRLVCSQYALAHPQRVRRLVLHGAAGIGVQPTPKVYIAIHTHIYI